MPVSSYFPPEIYPRFSDSSRSRMDCTHSNDAPPLQRIQLSLEKQLNIVILQILRGIAKAFFLWYTHIQSLPPFLSLGGRNSSEHPFGTPARTHTMVLSPGHSTSTCFVSAYMQQSWTIFKHGIFFIILFLTTLWLSFCLLTPSTPSSRHWGDLVMVSSRFWLHSCHWENSSAVLWADLYLLRYLYPKIIRVTLPQLTVLLWIWGKTESSPPSPKKPRFCFFKC